MTEGYWYVDLFTISSGVLFFPKPPISQDVFLAPEVAPFGSFGRGLGRGCRGVWI